MDNALGILGLARKAGRLEVGEEPVGAAARAKRARVIVIASDAAENTVRRARHFAEVGNCAIVITPYTKDELGGITGRGSCAMAAVSEASLSYLFVKKLADSDYESYGEAADELKIKAERIEQRKREKRAHDKNIKKGKK